ncbi:unnamed protein product [Toxocara canis]|uniref:SERPIN domain-containing protein n=1 Tax=Toxocara canis TaxID=6265 RepID=A0A183U7T0_TOXCA|nr:unnamed protein product [Toxocara canis]
MKQLSTPAAGYNLSSANRLFVADDFDILQSYKKLINDNFGGQLQQIDFARPAEAANVSGVSLFHGTEPVFDSGAFSFTTLCGGCGRFACLLAAKDY